jgi:chemotaxis protein CheX
MDPLYGEALSSVIQSVMKVVFGLEVRVIASRIEDDKKAPFEVSGIIGLTGPVQGSIVISMPMALARELTARMLDERDSERCSTRDISDCIGELSNIAAGNVLSRLDPRKASGAQMSLPNVVMGSHKVVWGSKDAPCALMLYESSLGVFAAESNVRDSSASQEKEAHHVSYSSGR